MNLSVLLSIDEFEELTELSTYNTQRQRGRFPKQQTLSQLCYLCFGIAAALQRRRFLQGLFLRGRLGSSYLQNIISQVLVSIWEGDWGMRGGGSTFDDPIDQLDIWLWWRLMWMQLFRRRRRVLGWSFGWYRAIYRGWLRECSVHVKVEMERWYDGLLW